MVDLAVKFNWTYVSLVYSEGEYGELGAHEFKRNARAQNVCIAFEHKITHHNELSEVFDILIQKSQGAVQDIGATVVILLTRGDDTKALLQASSQGYHRVQKKLTWMAAEGWDMAGTTTIGAENASDGAIIVSMDSSPVREFNEYFLSLRPGHSKFDRNPWLKEFWERKFGCKLSRESKAPFENICEEGLQLTAEDFQPDDNVQFVIDAVYALAYGLHTMWTDACQSKSRKTDRRQPHPLCPALQSVDGKTLYDYLLKLSFQDIVGKTVQFNERGDVSASHKIFNYRKTASRGYRYFEIGKWQNGFLHLNESNMDWQNANNIPPSSKCSRDCDPGYRKARIKDQTCCWLCMGLHTN